MDRRTTPGVQQRMWLLLGVSAAITVVTTLLTDLPWLAVAIGSYLALTLLFNRGAFALEARRRAQRRARGDFELSDWPDTTIDRHNTLD